MRDRNHYGRERLFTYLLNTSDSAVWVVGSRRIGKTSLLRQLEYLTDTPQSDLVPLFWDMQGCANSGDLSFELFMAIEDETARFGALGVAVGELEGQDALVILRRVGRTLAARGKTLLLLIDEAEVLINLARTEPGWLARLRKVLQDGHQRTILTSTKLLAQLNELTADWETSPFLFGFSMVNLWSLDDDSASALVEQRQSDHPFSVDPALMDEVLEQTNRHPYLLQYLCQRLCVEQADGTVGLRPATDEDLEPDHLLAGFFMIDFQHLTLLERRILLAVAEQTIIGEAELLRALGDQAPDRVRTFVWGMEKLGYLRQVMGQWAVGNEYLRRWLRQEWDTLRQVQTAAVDESSFEQILQLGYTQESQAFQNEVQSLESGYAALSDMQHRGQGDTGKLEQELDRLQRYLSAARRDLHRTQAGSQPGAQGGSQGSSQGGAAHRGSAFGGDEGPPLFRAPTRRGV
ncbi:MAG: hypothetical protein U0X20_12575 [Caldilineaceae bacterium]